MLGFNLNGEVTPLAFPQLKLSVRLKVQVLLSLDNTDSNQAKHHAIMVGITIKLLTYLIYRIKINVTHTTEHIPSSMLIKL